MVKKLYAVRIILVALLLVGCLAVGCSRYRVVERYSGAKAAQYLRGRYWLDRFPENRKQSFVYYVFAGRRDIGIHVRNASTFKASYEYFAFRDNSGKLSFQFLHDDRKADTKYVIEQIQPTGRFNLKLTLYSDPQENGRKSEYFSNTEWGKSDDFPSGMDLRDFFNN